jgi:hypothetical protein
MRQRTFAGGLFGRLRKPIRRKITFAEMDLSPRWARLRALIDSVYSEPGICCAPAGL